MLRKNVVIAIGSSVYNSDIKQKKITVDELFNKLKAPQIRNKKDGLYFVFASFSEDTRNAHAVKFYYGATLDIDYSNISANHIRKTLRPLKCAYAIYTTHSHQAEDRGNRFRVVIPYHDPVSKEKHVEATIYLNSLFGASGVDTSSKALSRPMYLPACPKDRKEHFYFYQSNYTKFFNPVVSAEVPAHLKWEIGEMNASAPEKVDITEEITEGGRNDHIARITGTLIQQGKTLQEVIDFCDEVNQLKFTPPMKSSEVARTVKSVWQSHTRNHGDKDWSYEQILERVKKSENIDRDLEHLLDIIGSSVDSGKTSPVQLDRLVRQIKKKDKDVSVTALKKEIKEAAASSKKEKKESRGELNLDEELDSPVIDKIRKEFKNVFFVASQNLIYNRKYETFYKLEGFNNQQSHLKDDFGGVNLSPFRILDQIEAIGKVDAVKYHPGKDSPFSDANGMLCLNSFKPSTVKPFKGNVKLMLRHFRYLFPNRFERRVMLEFIAYNYQNPGKKIMWCPVIKGRKGIGKSIIANEMLSAIFGESNIRQLNNSLPLLKEFNSWQTDSQIVVIHELYISNRLDTKQQVTESIKSFITDRYLTVRKMHTDGFQTENVTNALAFTNHEDALYITPDERRFCMIRCEVEPQKTQYYVDLVKFLRKNKEAIAYYFKNLEIKTISPYSLPRTKYTEEIISSSRNWAESILNDELEDSQSVLHKAIAFTWNSVCNVIMNRVHKEGFAGSRLEDIYNGTSSSGRVLRQALIENGFKQYETSGPQSRIRIDGKAEKVWITPKGVSQDALSWRVGLIKKEASKFISEAEVEFAQ